ncbi:hypothetical protein [Rhodococcus triatomae]|nr:hypothetical protein G419_25307 [Rhodococcus triatomae BKS 15-14]
MAVKIVWNQGAMYELRSSPEVVALLEAIGNRILEAAGGEQAGYVMSSQQGAKRPQGRWRVSVATATAEAMLDNAKNNTLIRALGASGGG